MLRIDPAEHQVGVGHRRVAAAAVARRAGIGAGAVGTDRDAREAIDARDRTAARADLDHLDHRDAHRHAAALAEAIRARDLEHARRLRLQVVDQAHLRRGAAHVERQHALHAVLHGDVLRKDRPARRPRLDQPDRKGAAGFHRGEAAARDHQIDGTPQAGGMQIHFQPGEVAGDDGLHIRVGASGAEALVLAHLGRDLARQRHWNGRQLLLQQLAHAALVRAIGIAVQKADRDAFDFLRAQGGDRLQHRALIERQQHRAVGRDALAHRQPPLARYQRRRLLQVEVVLLEAALGAELDRVAKALGGQERGARALALDQRVGREGGAVDDDLDVTGTNPGRFERGADALEHRLLGRRRRGEDLDRPLPRLPLGDHVGEGTANVDGDTIAPGLWVMASGKRALASAFSGVTPQAQNTGSSPGATAIDSPPSGRARSRMPIACGSPTCTGAPCTVG